MGGGGGLEFFAGTAGARGRARALSGGTLYAAANTGIATDAGGMQTFLQTLPKAPPPIPNNRPLTRFEELVLNEKLADRETLPQYHKVTSGFSLNAGHSKGFETNDLKAGDDIFVYVKNNNMFAVPLEVKAGPSFAKNELQEYILAPRKDKVFRFTNRGQLTRYLSIDAQRDSFLVEYHIFTRGNYAPR